MIQFTLLIITKTTHPTCYTKGLEANVGIWHKTWASWTNLKQGPQCKFKNAMRISIGYSRKHKPQEFRLFIKANNISTKLTIYSK